MWHHRGSPCAPRVRCTHPTYNRQDEPRHAQEVLREDLAITALHQRQLGQRSSE